MECPLYQNYRQELFVNLSRLNFNITIENLLKGDPTVKNKTNIVAMIYIQDFIACTNRFAWKHIVNNGYTINTGQDVL